MANQEKLQEFSETYLTSLISDVSPSINGAFDTLIPFGELGVDSFHALKIVKRLESDFGTLSKTLMFEYFNVQELAGYFVNKHGDKLLAICSIDALKNTKSSIDAEVVMPLRDANERKTREIPKSSIVKNNADITLKPILLPVNGIDQYPEIKSIVASLFDRYKNESSVSRGTRNIAPNLFIGSRGEGYFNYSRSKNIILVYAYTGPTAYFDELATEMFEHCAKRQFEMVFLVDSPLEAVGDVSFSSTPFGAMQRVRNIEKFTLSGNKIRRLRYVVSKFSKAGKGTTKEFDPARDQNLRKDIAGIIDRWCEPRSMINPLIHIAKEEILSGTFDPIHRIFLTYLDDTLQNVIIISPLCESEKGYLMDLEFYQPDMPLGGLEFAIVNIIEMLVSEGCSMLSLGATLGPKLAPSANADMAIDQELDSLREQNIFNDDGNLQFKNKFLPENRSILLCREKDSKCVIDIVDIIMMIADPARMQTSDEENFNVSSTVVDRNAMAKAEIKAQTKAEITNKKAHASEAVTTSSSHKTDLPLRSSENLHDPLQVSINSPLQNRMLLLAEHDYNPLNIASEKIELDLKTDSWAELDMPSLRTHMQTLHAQLQHAPSLNESLKNIFPFEHFVLTSSGRDAENIFYTSWESKGVILQNLLFPTTIYHQIENDFTPHELPCIEVFNADSHERFKGNLDWQALENYLQSKADAVAFVCIEISNNAAGGMPVSMAHLQKLKSRLRELKIPLVIDGTRVVENARFMVENEPEQRGKDTWQVVREMLACADALVMSFPKDFGINKGGFVATNDKHLLSKLQRNLIEEGENIDVIDRKLIALSLSNPKRILSQVIHRMDAVKAVWHALDKHNIPVVKPVGTHCILIDVAKVSQFKQFNDPLESFINWVFLNAGIRVAAHNAGMQKSTMLNTCVRLAIPVGLVDSQVQLLITKLVSLFECMENITEVVAIENQSGNFGSVDNRYRLINLHNRTSEAFTWTGQGKSSIEVEQEHLPVVQGNSVKNTEFLNRDHSDAPLRSTSLRSTSSVPTSIRSNTAEIAVVGMAGRYPKATSMQQLWENLKHGVDCVAEMSEDRFEKRFKNKFSKKYRGGFIDGIDKFDSIFFNISPLEAEMLDPQERLFLEVVWETLEDAGYYPETIAPDNTARNVGVYVGAVWSMYQIIGVEEKLLGNDVNPNSFLWSIANRISYFMNLTGPSITLDTACSSSLTAMHLACEAIQKGDISAAIVGGVNLDVHQSKLDINTAGGTQSIDGVCRSFGHGANGYVAGEGVGAVLLKPLEQAIYDKDNIYGVIKSISTNHGGKTSGYAVPAPRAQSQLIVSTLEKAGIDARSIGYIEAHGTGTELGDPIEISGLTSAFEPWKVAAQSCAIGSIKSNIGHLEAAAGVVSVSKTLLQMKHRQIAPSLHSSTLNEHIDFASTPFYVVQKLEPWQKRSVDGVELPRRAGISSFGAGGANAHVILEEFDTASLSSGASGLPEGELIIPLSARNENQLRQVALRLHEYLSAQVSRPSDVKSDALTDIAYTLQLGRKSFKYRVAFIANTAQDLLDKLDQFAHDRKSDSILVGNAKNANGVTSLLNRAETEEFIKILSQRRDSQRVARMWVDGLLQDWQGYKSISAGKRISLPTYPFADKRHWIRKESTKPLSTLTEGARIHPLIDANESTFSKQVFKKSFTDKEFFIYDHHVSDIPTLPGVAYLELARKAGELAAKRKVQKIRNIVWVSPLTVANSRTTEARIELIPAGEQVNFEVFGEREDGSKQLFSQGKLIYALNDELNAQAEYIDIETIKSRCKKVIDAERAYPMFKTLGLNLGTSFQVLREVYKSDRETLGVLQIPEGRRQDFSEYMLHPSLVDGAFQAGMGAAMGDEIGEMYVPYSIGEVEILHPLTETCYSYITPVEESKKSKSNLAKSNVLIVDVMGKILVRVRESIGVPLVDVHEKPTKAKDADEFFPLYYSPEWINEPLPEQIEMSEKENANTLEGTILLFDFPGGIHKKQLKGEKIKPDNVIRVEQGDAFQKKTAHHYVINPNDEKHYVELFTSLKSDQCVLAGVCYAWPAFSSTAWGTDKASHIQDALSKSIYALLSLSQALIAQNYTKELRILYLYCNTDTEDFPVNEAIAGFSKTLKIEHPKLVCQLVEIPQDTLHSSDIWNVIFGELQSRAKNSGAVRYLHADNQKAQRYVSKLKSVDLDPEQGQKPLTSVNLKHRGVYLITGGAGGLGLIFAEYFSEQCQARLVLTGRSEESEITLEMLNRLRALGAEPIYLAADVSNNSDIARIIELTKSEYGEINGIVHSAGVIKDAFIRNKTKAEMKAVLSAKVFGTVYLDELSAGENLDFFVTFSSMAAVGGNIGQSDYAYANHFMDSWIKRREKRRTTIGDRSGKSLSLNWSIWAEGGMQFDEQTELFFRNNLGIKPLDTKVGLTAFNLALSSQFSQCVVVEGEQEKMELAWGIKEKQPKIQEAAQLSDSTKEIVGEGGGNFASLIEKVQNTLCQLVTDLLKIDAEDVEVDKILLDIGFDSIGLTTYANAVNGKYKLDITPVLFFEYPSIKAIAEHLVVEYQEKVLEIHGSDENVVSNAISETPAYDLKSNGHHINNNDAKPSTNEEQFTLAGINKGWQEVQHSDQTFATTQRGMITRRRFIENPIAVVGISCVMPQSANTEEYWDLLSNARSGITEIPDDRWDWRDYFGDPLQGGNKTNCKWGGFMKEIDKFDASFFGISRTEAEMMDPQQRLFLEQVWKAVEDSGQKVSDLSGTKTGLFVGASTHDYTEHLNDHKININAFTAAGNTHSILANRVSFLLNLRGPSAPLDTACSSSLVALHRAIESIHTGTSDMAIVGGVQLILSPAGYISFGITGMLSPDGTCRTFDKQANGYVRGEGAGAIFLKPLSAAEKYGNPIYAVIKATAENNGGRVTMLTAPNPVAQAEVMMEAYDKAEIDPTTVGYIECHGTATSLADPVEIKALKSAFSELYKKHNKQPAAPHIGLSSAKANIGHLETGAGIAGIIKALLAIKHKQIPPILHFKELNPYISLDNSPFYIVDKIEPWKAFETDQGKVLPRRAGVSAFGFGGANVHIVLEEYLALAKDKDIQKTEANNGPYLIVLSAKNPERLKEYAQQMLVWLENKNVDMAEFSYTLQVGRDEMPARLAFVAKNKDECKQLFANFVSDEQDNTVFFNHISKKKQQKHFPEDLVQLENKIKDGQLTELAQYWVEGVAIDWLLLYEEYSPSRISVPTYPFAKERYWAVPTITKDVERQVEEPAELV